MDSTTETSLDPVVLAEQKLSNAILALINSQDETSDDEFREEVDALQRIFFAEVEFEKMEDQIHALTDNLDYEWESPLLKDIENLNDCHIRWLIAKQRNRRNLKAQ